MKLSIIVPALNEEKTILKVIEKLFSLDFPGWEKELIVINDGSTDGTEKIVLKFEDRIKYFRHETNQGKGVAIKTGLELATGDAVIIQDADLEYDPSEFARLLAQYDGETVVYGSRNINPHKQGYSIYVLGVKVITALVNLLLGQRLTDVYTCYKLFPSSIIKSIDLESRGFEFEMEVTVKLLKKGVKIMEVPISYNPRSFEEGKKIRGKDALIGVWVLLKNLF